VWCPAVPRTWERAGGWTNASMVPQVLICAALRRTVLAILRRVAALGASAPERDKLHSRDGACGVHRAAKLDRFWPPSSITAGRDK